MATTMLSLIIDAVENLITSARIVPKRPLVNFDPSNPQELTVKAFARMAADTPNRIETIRQGYENDYGFNHTDGFARTFSGLRHGASNAIWNPYVGIIIDDIDAVISVSTALGVPPPNVLALWIMEGKSSFNNFLHGATGSYQILIGTDVRISQVHSYLRSLVLYQAFGSDQYSAFRRVPGADNELQPPEFSHDSKFDNTFQSLKDAGVSGPAQDSIDDAREYFTKPGGAIMSSLMSSGGVRVPDPVPSGTIINATIKLRKNSLASFLYLQHALFLAHQAQLKTMFDSEYGGNIDLTSTPWATYVFWNGGAAAYNLHFKKEPGRVSPDSRITELFGHTPSKLSSVELGKYYRDDIPPPINPTDPKPEEVISRSALCNAVQFKYLIDAITPWFNP